MSVGSELSFFKEKAEVNLIIIRICGENWSVSFEHDLSLLDKVLVKYQEQPQLLGPYVGDLLAPLIDRILILVKNIDRTAYAKSEKSGSDLRIDFPHLHAVCKVVQLICRVRGFKHVIKQFPHEVEHFEVCMTLLKAQVNKEAVSPNMLGITLDRPFVYSCPPSYFPVNYSLRLYMCSCIVGQARPHDVANEICPAVVAEHSVFDSIRHLLSRQRQLLHYFLRARWL